jgi:hypothetical protein
MLIRGGESPKKIKLLISLTKIQSEELVAAVINYYMVGVIDYPQAKIGNFNRAIKTIEKINNVVNSIKELDDD